MEILLSIVTSLFHTMIQNPIYSAFWSLILFACLLKLYCKLTTGICKIDQDMRGKTVLITGASAGIGKATAFDLARRNARVLLACRNIGKANKVAEEIKKATGNQNVVVKCLDLCSLESVRECAQSVLDTENKLHVLINNAGISGMRRKLTADGCEIVMQSNHFGHFLFTLLLLDLLKKSSPSRIINVSSEAHKWAKFNVEDLNNEKKQKGFTTYCNSKLANILFTRELAEKLKGTGVTVNTLHPGVVKTDIVNTSKISKMTIFTKILFLVVGKTAVEGAQTTIQLAIDPKLEKTTGKYFMDCKEASVSKEAKDKNTAKRLFELSEKVVGKSFS